MTTTERNPAVVVTSDETMPGVLERLREAAHGGHAVDLVVPIDSPLLLTAREFRTLKDAVDADRLAVRLRTSDPLRLQLAERLGIRTQALPRPRPKVTVGSPASSPPLRQQEPAPEDDWPGHTAVAAPVLRPDRAPDPVSHWPSADGPGTLADEQEEPGEPAEDPAPSAAAENPPRRWLPVAAALAALVAVAAVAIRFVVPQATIRVVPRTEPVTAAVVFDVTGDGTPIDDAAAFALASQERQVEVVWEGSALVTGVRVEPDGTASSSIELRNPSPEALNVDAGTTVATEAGVEFTFTEAVAVPAADAATGNPGAATGQVQAREPGSGGNVGTGELGGRLPNGVYYSNRMGAAEGGTDKEFPVVAQADLDALSAAAKEAVPELVAVAVAETEPGETILTSTVAVAEQSDEFDRQAGEEVAEVALRATLTVDVLTYDGDAAAKAIGPLLAAGLEDAAPAGFAVGPEDIAVGEPAAEEERDEAVRLEITATADAEAVLDETERAALAAALAGSSPEEAATVLTETEEIAEYSVEYHPSWLAPQIPSNTGRIVFEVAE